MSKATIYHNPRCSKSRQALAFLKEHGIEPTVIEYLTAPPSSSALKKILKMLGITPRELMRKKEAEYKALHLDDEDLTDAQLIQAMSDHPILIERPIVVIGDNARIARPTEVILEIIKS